MAPSAIAELIDRSPYNRGMVGSDILAQPGTVALSGADGAAVLFLKNPGVGIFEGHWLAPASTAKRTLAFGRSSLKYMFTDGGASIVFGLTPLDNRTAMLINRWLGFKAGAIIKTIHGECQYFSLTRRDFERGR